MAAGLMVFRGLSAGGAAVALLLAVVAVASYAALTRGTRLFPTVYLAAAAGTSAAALLAHFQGSH
jgi:hypothetical protein